MHESLFRAEEMVGLAGEHALVFERGLEEVWWPFRVEECVLFCYVNHANFPHSAHLSTFLRTVPHLVHCW